MQTSRRIPAAACTLFAALLMACASSGSGGGSGSPSTAGSPDVISQQELENSSLVGASVIDAVRRLRPRFLVGRSPGTVGLSGELLASTDGHTLVEVSELGRIKVEQVSEIRYLSLPDAAQRFGTRGTMGPVLMVTLKSH